MITIAGSCGFRPDRPEQAVIQPVAMPQQVHGDVSHLLQVLDLKAIVVMTGLLCADGLAMSRHILAAFGRHERHRF
jgi:hypothetical protein